MQLNADFNRRAAVHAASLAWVPSPMPGVERRLLDRVGAEVARATTIVRYAPDSYFSPHTHDGGEEFLVIDGVFQDERGDYPAGSYVRNPPTSRHTPRSTKGCSIFVKLWQFAPDDRTQVRVDTSRQSFLPVADRPGVAEVPLFRDGREQVRLERWEPNSVISLEVPGGIEILVLDGTFNDAIEDFSALSWLRLPDGEALRAKTGAQGCRLWVKTGHLAHVQTAPTQER
ncbi:MAG: cupin domain-containing protein [Pseudomonas sp.]|uniref:cupin domain-containing protein n=1 Tax=Pseudomonas sp. TaxID=306 RepID=UPI00299DD232|nr:cupin domain-containing protein [Pseudomonas sp.]MDX1723200.1 cupin domain-containing protein [Pseudomonas sp.]